MINIRQLVLRINRNYARVIQNLIFVFELEIFLKAFDHIITAIRQNITNNTAVELNITKDSIEILQRI